MSPLSHRLRAGRTGARRGLLRAAGLLAAALLLLLSATLSAGGPPLPAAAPTPAYDLSWHTIDSGGAVFVRAGSYALAGSIGQIDAGAPVTAGRYTLQPGFWAGARGIYSTYLPLVTSGFQPATGNER